MLKKISYFTKGNRHIILITDNNLIMCRLLTVLILTKYNIALFNNHVSSVLRLKSILL